MRWANAAGLLGAAAAIALGSELRVARPVRPLTRHWREMPIHPRDTTRLGVSFRPPQIDALGLELRSALQRLLEFPFELLRLGAYWQRLEPVAGAFVPEE